MIEGWKGVLLLLFFVLNGRAAVIDEGKQLLKTVVRSSNNFLGFSTSYRERWFVNDGERIRRGEFFVMPCAIRGSGVDESHFSFYDGEIGKTMGVCAVDSSGQMSRVMFMLEELQNQVLPWTHRDDYMFWSMSWLNEPEARADALSKAAEKANFDPGPCAETSSSLRGKTTLSAWLAGEEVATGCLCYRDGTRATNQCSRLSLRPSQTTLFGRMVENDPKAPPGGKWLTPAIVMQFESDETTATGRCGASCGGKCRVKVLIRCPTQAEHLRAVEKSSPRPNHHTFKEQPQPSIKPSSDATTMVARFESLGDIAWKQLEPSSLSTCARLPEASSRTKKKGWKVVGIEKESTTTQKKKKKKSQTPPPSSPLDPSCNNCFTLALLSFCQYQPCSRASCSGHGSCVSGVCQCVDGYAGIVCSEEEACMDAGSCHFAAKCAWSSHKKSPPSTTNPAPNAILDSHAATCSCSHGWVGSGKECFKAPHVNSGHWEIDDDLTYAEFVVFFVVSSTCSLLLCLFLTLSLCRSRLYSLFKCTCLLPRKRTRHKTHGIVRGGREVEMNAKR